VSASFKRKYRTTRYATVRPHFLDSTHVKAAAVAKQRLSAAVENFIFPLLLGINRFDGFGNNEIKIQANFGADTS
jgi:hypothetical protein